MLNFIFAVSAALMKYMLNIEGFGFQKMRVPKTDI